MLRRREFLGLVGGAAVAWPLASRAEGERKRRLGVLAGIVERDPEWQARMEAFLQRLQQLGWQSGRNVEIDYRYAVGDSAQIQAATKEIVAIAPDVILTMSNPLLAALLRETHTTPIVFAQVADPVGSGFASSLARPGGNATGFTNFEPSIGGKWLELLKEAAPDVTRALVVHNAQTAANVSMLRAAQAASSNIGVAVVPAAVNNVAEIEQALTVFARQPSGGVILIPHLVTVTPSTRVAELALQLRLPTVGAFRFMAAKGVLVSYGSETTDLFRRSADYVDRILRGSKPGELPIQQPTKFELFINLKTAKALGLTLAPTLLGRADQVIE
jgi:putative tryptophan/tyrosine transport system substrate-binding protein